MDVNTSHIDPSLKAYNRRRLNYRELFFHFRTNPGDFVVVHMGIES